MNSIIGKTPFSRFLLPVITGIIISVFFSHFQLNMIIPAISGITLMFISYLINDEKKYRYRWLFGVGLFIFLFSFSFFQYRQNIKLSEYNFTGNQEYYIGTISSIPEQKPRSIACDADIIHPDQIKNKRKKVKLYFEHSDHAWELKPGDEIVLYCSLEPFKNYGNPDDFNYERHMEIKGFSASGYVQKDNWRLTGRENLSANTLSQRFRAKALEFYKSFNLEHDAYAFISALTLGYKNDLPENLQEAFRASGTAHVLAVSGLHVGIIYIVINFLFSFLGKHGKKYVIRQHLVILFLWCYVFVAGMSASVVRAAIMLTINSIGKSCNRRGFTYNNLAAAAFFILIFKPVSLFDISFQMSFGAVFAILFFQPLLQKKYTPKNKAKNYLWNMTTVSLAAQLGVFPIVLYYFGTFPTYFFIANLLVVPLIGSVIYTSVPLILLNLPYLINIAFLDSIRNICQWILKTLIEITLRIVYITESLPHSQLSDNYISAVQLVLVLFFIYIFMYWVSKKRPHHLIEALVTIFIFLITVIVKIKTKPQPEIIVLNSNNNSEIALYYNNKRHYFEIPENGIIPNSEKAILRLSDNTLNNFYSDSRFDVDILILSGEKHANLNHLQNLFDPELIIIDSSVPRYLNNKISNECNKLGIEVHDIAKSGAYSLNF